MKIYIQGRISKLGGVEVYTPNDVTIINHARDVDMSDPVGLSYREAATEDGGKDTVHIIPWSRVIRVEIIQEKEDEVPAGSA